MIPLMQMDSTAIIATEGHRRIIAKSLGFDAE